METFVDPCAADASVLSPKTRVRLDAFERAIYSTIAYRDVFDFPPTLYEIHRFLHGIPCEKSEVQAALKGESLGAVLTTDGTFFALQGRNHIIRLRRERQAFLERFWPLALKYARLLANLPHVRMVGITGSLAAKNVLPDCDIDFMLLTDAGTMWRTRALAIATALFDQRFGSGKLCPNYLLSVAVLTLERKSLYDAQELTQMIPVFGREAYNDLRRANGWTASYLPNAADAPTEEHYFDRPKFPTLKKCIEWGSRSFAGRMLENYEATRKIRRFNETPQFKNWTKSTRETVGVRDFIRQDIEKAWQRRLDALDAVQP